MDLSQILSSMQPEDLERLRQTAANLMGGAAAKPAALTGVDPSLMETVGKATALLNAKDPRCDLLNALKPLLTGARRERAEEAIQLLRMTAILPRIAELGGRK